MRASVGVAELAAAAGMKTPAVRYHCRDPRGMLFGAAFREGRQWRIPVDAADTFLTDYRRWASLHKKREPATPPVTGSRSRTSIPRDRKTMRNEE